jgi:hypothetical protein
MTDYYCQVHGVFGDGSTWSTGMHVTSNQSESALLTTWSGAITNMWINSAYGIRQYLPIPTVATSVSVATLNATMHEISKSFLAISYPGTAPGDSLPYLNSAVLSLRGTNIQKHGRGRMYLPALEETFVNDDVVVPAATANIKLAIQSVFSAINADGSTVFVTNKKALKSDPTYPLYSKTVVSTPFVSNKPARQSRRTRHKAAQYV